MRTMTPTTFVVLLVSLLTVRAGVAHAAPIFSIGNGTPGTEFFIQGQSFTPSVAGNDGAGTPSAGEGGAVRLLAGSPRCGASPPGE